MEKGVKRLRGRKREQILQEDKPSSSRSLGQGQSMLANKLLSLWSLGNLAATQVQEQAIMEHSLAIVTDT